MTKITVVIPSYNHDKYIAEAIQSVLDQTYQDFEIVITDDGSIDKTVEVIRGFTDPRLKLFCLSSNQGACAAVNNCLQKAQGEYIAVLNSDDAFQLDKLEKQVRFLDSHPNIGAVFSYAQIIDESSKNYPDENHFYKKIFIQSNRTRFEWLNRFFFRGNCLCHPSVLIRKRCYETVGLYDERFAQLPDFDFWIRLCMEYEIHILPENLVKFRIRSDEANASGNRPETRIRHSLEIPQILKNYLKPKISENFLKIFPVEANDTFTIEKDLVPFLIAKLAMQVQVDRVAYQYFAINTLYQLFGDLDISKKIKKRYAFDFANLIKLTGMIDLFSITSEKISSVNHENKSESEVLKKLSYQPLISVVMPVFNTPERYLREAINSVLKQTYSLWELCIADDASTLPHVRQVLEEYSSRDPRIKVVLRETNGHISRASNSALGIATGEFVAFLDHDDLLAPDALYEVASLLKQHPDADMVYSDEDKIDDRNCQREAHYKPDWYPDSFLSHMYTCHLGTYRCSLVNKIGGFRVGYEGCQDYDLVLRFTEKTKRIFHIPKILYHWRMHPDSFAYSPDAKPYAFKAAVKALNEAIQRRGEKGKVSEIPSLKGYYSVRYAIESFRLVSIVILAKGEASHLDRCLESLFARTNFPNYEVVVVNDGSNEAEIATVIQNWQTREINKLRYYRLDCPYSYAQFNNHAVGISKGEYLLFLSVFVEIVSKNWIGILLEQAQRDSIGAVGSLLLYPNNSIYHTGIVLGIGEIGDRILKGTPRSSLENLAYSHIIKNVSAVSGSCLMCRREVFEKIGGFDERFSAYSDIDLCLKMMSVGYRNICLPHINLYIHEFRSWGAEAVAQRKIQQDRTSLNLIREKWHEFIDRDPCYSPTLIAKANLANSELRTSQNQLDANKNIPLVSICIPTHNGEKHITDALESTIAQTYPHLEIIISDDGSTDRTIDIAESSLKNFPGQVSIIQHPRYGLVGNFNFCISQAKGKYVKFLLQDDLLEPNCIEEMVNLAEQDEDIGIVFSSRHTFISKDSAFDSVCIGSYRVNSDIHLHWTNLETVQSGQDAPVHDLLTELNFTTNRIGEPTTVLIRKKVLDRLGGFDPKLTQLLDPDLWYRILGHYKVGFVNKVLSSFRIYAAQQSNKNYISQEHLRDYQRSIDKISYDPIYDFLTPEIRSRLPEKTPKIIQSCFLRNSEESLLKLSDLVERYQRDPSNLEVLNMLRETRQLFANQWLQLTPQDAQTAYKSDLGKALQILISSNLKHEPLLDREFIFANTLASNIAQDYSNPKVVQYLVAGMLYCSAWQFKISYDYLQISSSFLADFMKFILEIPIYFQRIGEADSYFNHTQIWFGILHDNIFNSRDIEIWQYIARYFRQSISFLLLYSRQGNVNDIYKQWAEIVEFSLTRDGHIIHFTFPEKPEQKQKIRLGILHTAFSHQVETFSVISILGYLDREQFEVILYVTSSSGHQLEDYCQSQADKFIALPTELASQVQTIRTDEIDILIVNADVIASSIPISLLALHRLAKLQISCGSSPIALSMRNIDYHISGSLAKRAGDDNGLPCEKLIKLDGTGFCLSHYKESSASTIKPIWNNLITGDSTVFISTVNFSKITPELIEIWAEIMSVIPNSVLVLCPFSIKDSQAVTSIPFIRNTFFLFSTKGIEGKRLFIVNQVLGYNDIQECLRSADVYLASAPFSDYVSVIEALEVGIPTVVMDSDSQYSRLGADVLRDLRITDLITDDRESYISLAIRLGSSSLLRQSYQKQIRQKMQRNPGFLDSHAYATQLGVLLKRLFHKQQDAESQTHLHNFELKQKERARPYSEQSLATSSRIAPQSLLTSVASPLSSQFLNYLKGYINLYAIDPLDTTVLESLRQVRMQFADFWLNAPTSQLEAIYQNGAGKVHKAIINCGILSEPLRQNEREFLDELIYNLSNAHNPSRFINYLLATLLYIPPEKLPSQDIPQWLASPSHPYEIV